MELARPLSKFRVAGHEKGEQVLVQSETRLEFRLEQPVEIGWEGRSPDQPGPLAGEKREARSKGILRLG